MALVGQQEPYSVYLYGVFVRQKIHIWELKFGFILGFILKPVLKTKSCTIWQIR